MGQQAFKRIYGDWTKPHLNSWKETLLSHSIQPIQQFAYTTGKNSTDSAMIIDAMDLLYTDTFDGFCIVSSDSDFTKLASRVRESGVVVYGFGERKTPSAFVTACDKFVYLDVLRAKTDEEQVIEKKPLGELKQDTKMMNLFRNAVDVSSDDSGWANLAVVGSNMAKHSPDFDPRNYGYTKLGELFAATKLFEIEERQIGSMKSKQLFVKNKRKRAQSTKKVKD